MSHAKPVDPNSDESRRVGRTGLADEVMKHECECADCGASGQFGSCAGLFDVLLALDLQRLQPWGQFHGLNVACFLLQHPTHPLAGAAAIAGQWQHVTTFVTEGLNRVHELEAQRVRANRHGERPWLELPLPPARSQRPAMTIEAVSVDGTFPADGYADRMLAWGESIVAERPRT